jgi:hypothetical protein
LKEVLTILNQKKMKKVFFSLAVMLMINLAANAYSCRVTGSKGSVTVRGADGPSSCFALARAVYQML